MRLEQLTVRLRTRSGWEAMELGMALVRRHAAAIYTPWLLLTLPIFMVLNVAGWAIDQLWLASVLMWWLKPVFDRIPLYVISRAVFGAVPAATETLRAQGHWGLRAMWHYLSWRRLSPVRSLNLPVDLLEGGKDVDAAILRERRRVLGSAAYGNAALLTLVCWHFELAIWLGLLAAVLMFVPVDYLPEAARTAWMLMFQEPTWWAQVGMSAFAWLAMGVVEPFFVGAGFGLYLNRRTQIEAWDVEIVFRKLRKRLAAAATPWLLLIAMLAGHAAILPMAHAQNAAHEQTEDEDEQATAPVPPTLPEVFADQRVDDAAFRRAADRAYQDPLLGEKRSQQSWQRRNPDAPEQDRLNSLDFPWLASFASVFAFIGEWGLWILVALLVNLLLATLRHWLPWMRGQGRRGEKLSREVETRVRILPEALPDDVPAAARRLWQQGHQRDALALLYRASVESMSTRVNLVLPPGATEAQCLRASRRQPEEQDRALFARTVRVWQYAAYAQQFPDDGDFEQLLGGLQQRYGWSA